MTDLREPFTIGSVCQTWMSFQWQPSSSNGCLVCTKLVAYCLVPTSQKPPLELALLGAVVGWLRRGTRNGKAQSLSSLLLAQGSPSRSGQPRWCEEQKLPGRLCAMLNLFNGLPACVAIATGVPLSQAAQCCIKRSGVKISGKQECCFKRAGVCVDPYHVVVRLEFSDLRQPWLVWSMCGNCSRECFAQPDLPSLLSVPSKRRGSKFQKI